MCELTASNGFILNGSSGCRTKRGLLPWQMETVCLVLLSDDRTAVEQSSLDSCPWHCASSLLAFRPEMTCILYPPVTLDCYPRYFRNILTPREHIPRINPLHTSLGPFPSDSTLLLHTVQFPYFDTLEWEIWEGPGVKARDVSKKIPFPNTSATKLLGVGTVKSNVSGKCFCTGSSCWFIHPGQANTPPILPAFLKVSYLWPDFTVPYFNRHCKLVETHRVTPYGDYTLITNLMHWLLFIHKLLFSSTCFEHQVLIFRRT